MTGLGWAAASVFVAAMVALNRHLRHREAQGAFDVAPSSVSQPGLRRLFDFGETGWSRDGINQRPVD